MKIPDKIYLQFEDDYEVKARAYEEVTWDAKRRHRSDVEYVKVKKMKLEKAAGKKYFYSLPDTSPLPDIFNSGEPSNQ